MSKKNKKAKQMAAAEVSGASQHGAEYRVIKHDLWKVLYLNLVYLAALLSIYYTDRSSQYLEHWFARLFHF